jgi:hypothetical protein
LDNDAPRNKRNKKKISQHKESLAKREIDFEVLRSEAPHEFDLPKVLPRAQHSNQREGQA